MADLDHERFAVLILHDGKVTAAFARLNEHEQRAVLAYRDKQGTSELRFSIYLQHHDSPSGVPLGRGAAAAKRAATVDHLSLHSDSMRAGTMERDAQHAARGRQRSKAVTPAQQTKAAATH